MNIYNEVTKCLDLDEPSLITEISLAGKAEKSGAAFIESVLFVAGLLHSLGLKPGDRAALVGKNSANWAAVFLGIAKTNMVSVLVDASLSRIELKRQVESTQVQVVFCDDEFSEWFDGVSVVSLNSLVSVYKIPRNDSLTICEEQIASIIFSSGTTARATGIMHTHDSLLESVWITGKENNLNGGRYLGIIPCSHIYGLICTLMGPLLFGARICYIQDTDGALIAETMRDFKPTVFPCVAKVFEAFMDKAMAAVNSSKAKAVMFGVIRAVCRQARLRLKINLGKKLMKKIHTAFGGEIDILCCAGSPVAADIAEFYLDAGFNFLITYGATETGIPTIGHRGTTLSGEGCGKPYPDCEVKLGEDSELLIKSPRVMAGYWNDPGLTAVAFSDGWFKSGDIGEIRLDGNIYVTGRCKDAIVLETGMKLDPAMIESSLADIRDVKEMVACGIPKENGADDVHIFVTVEHGDWDATVREIKSKRLEHGVSVKGVHRVDEIPRTALQKPKRYLLREWLLDRQLVAEPRETSSGSTWETFVKIIARIGGVESEQVQENSRVFKDFHTDSLSSFVLLCEIEDAMKVKLSVDLNPNVTVAELWDMVNAGSSARRGRKYPLSKNVVDFFVFKGLRAFFNLFYSTITTGQENIPADGGYILCSNHVTPFDYMWLVMGMRKHQLMRLFCMAKAELLRFAIARPMFRIFGLIPIERGGIVGEAMRNCEKTLNDGCGLIVHPEGNRTPDGELLPFKLGPVS